MAAPTIADLAVLPDLEKLVVFDWELARALEEQSWTATGGGSYYLSFTDGEVVRVQIDGVELAERFSVATVDAVASTFYYDITNRRLYVHTPDGDSPAAAGPKYSVVAFFFKGFANRPVVMARYRETLIDGRFDRWNSSSDPECWTDTIVGTAAVARDSANVYDRYSAYSAKLTVGAVSSSIALTQTITLRLSCNALLRLKFKGTGTLHLQLYDSASNVWLDSSGTWQTSAQTINAGAGSGSWAEFSLSFVAHASYRSYILRIFADTNGDSLYVENAELKRYYTKDFFAPYLPAGSIPNVRHSIGSLNEPEEQLSFGVVNFNDDGWFASKYFTYLWANKKAYLKLGELAVGEINAEYDDLVPLFTGLSRQPTLTRGGCSIEVKDLRAELGKIPITTFDSTTYPNCATEWLNKAIPIGLGIVQNITPPCSDTTTYTYKPSEVTFNGTSFVLASIYNVYKDGVVQTLGTHYTVNLTAGTFTMLSNPGTAVITCDIVGLKMGFPDKDVDYYYPAGWLKFLFVNLNGISAEEIGWGSLLGVVTTRGLQALCKWFGDYIESYEVLNTIKRGAMIQVYTRPNGEICFNTITSAIPSDAPRFVNEDYKAPFEILQDVDQSYYQVIVQGDEDPTAGKNEHEYASTPTARAQWQHGVSRVLGPLETYLENNAQILNLAGYYADILKEPPTIIKTILPAQALLLNPTDKIYINYSILDADGTEVSIFSEQVFIILDITKDVNAGTAAITAIKYTAAMAWTMS